MSKPRQTFTLVYEMMVVEPENTRCKHGRGLGCERCGTSNRRDTVHRTRGGKGCVARLLKESEDSKR